MGWRQAVARAIGRGRDRGALSVLLVALIVLGVVAGSMAVNWLPGDQKTNLAAAVTEMALRVAQGGQPLPAIDVFSRSLANNLKLGGVIWLLGFTVMGIPFILALLFLRGFIIGFTVGFLVNQAGWQGVLIAFSSVLLPSLLAIPALFMLAAGAVTFAYYRRRQRVGLSRSLILPEFAVYGFVGCVAGVVLVAASLFDGFAGPALLRFLLARS